MALDVEREVGVAEGADEESIAVFLDDGTGRGFCAADEGDAGKDWRARVGFDERFLDVQAILNKDERRVRIIC